MENFELNHFNCAIDDDEVSYKVITKLNEVFKDDIRNLHKAKECVKELQTTQDDLEKKLLFATSEAPDKISKAISTAEAALAVYEQIEARIKELDEGVSKLKQKKEMVTIFEDLAPSIKIIQEAERVKAYHSWISSVRDISLQIEVSLKLGQDDSALNHYKKLKEFADLIISSQCDNLKDYTCQVVIHWHSILLCRLENEFQSLLKALKWPFVMASAKPPSPSGESLRKLETLVRQLLQLPISEAIQRNSKPYQELGKTSQEMFEEKVVPSLVSDFSVTFVPVQLLLKPLEVRFLYHFSGQKATNSRRNPEWYLTQVLKWISLHEDFIKSYIQPILNKSDNSRVDARVEFLKGLLRLVVLKLSCDFPQIQEDEDLFCQTVQETLNFERELRLGLGYPSSQPTVLSVITQASVFNTWIGIERKFALELMDEFVASPNAWQADEGGGICQCGEQLILLLQGITDRYKPLSQPGHRIQFLDLQLELLDDFRVRILQLTKGELSEPLHSNYISILNTVHHLVLTISDWADVPFFIEMQYFKDKFKYVEKEVQEPVSHYPKTRFSGEHMEKLAKGETSEQVVNKSIEIPESVFKLILSLYARIETEMLGVVNQHVLTEVRARSQSFRKDKWFVSPSESFHFTESSILEISPSLCPLMETLVKHLLLLRNKLAPHLFSKFWKDLAAALNKFIYEEVILQNTFSEYGALQLKRDITKALFPVFGEFSTKPENFFPLVKESLILLTLPRPTAFLLRDTLQQANAGRDFYSQTFSPVKALEERGVFLLSVHDALTILNIRTNMTHL